MRNCNQLSNYRIWQAWFGGLFIAVVLMCGSCKKEQQQNASTVAPSETNYSGYFDVQTTLVYDFCGSGGSLDGLYEIVISGSEFSMNGEYFGSWSGDSQLGNGTTATQPSGGTGDCSLVTHWSVSVSFVTEDYFTGTLTYHSTAEGDCGGYTGCQTSWHIYGTRQ